jgi:WhiB family redox-sensing transcriptional regulator
MRREVAAKAVCLSCPVRAECAAHALVAREPYGVWGGFTEAERLRLLATGWEDLSDRVGRRVDVSRLEARLGRRLPAQRQWPGVARALRRSAPAHRAARPQPKIRTTVHKLWGVERRYPTTCGQLRGS